MSSAPFLPSNFGHPNFVPVKIGKSLHSDVVKNAKQPKPPDKPLMPYMRYSKKIWDDVRLRYPDLKVWEISKIVGQMWRDLPDEDKQEYIEAYETDKTEYNELLKLYHSSPAYQSWIASLKTKVNKEYEERDSHKRKDKRTNVMNSPQKSEGKVSIQPLESELDDEDEYFSMKHLAAARYYRNHRLVSEIFSDSLVPDVRTIVTNSRLLILRKQVESLTMHQKKLDEELKQLEERFQIKKRILLESSEKFNNEMNKRFASKPVDEVAYQKMFDKALEQIRKDHLTKVSKSNTSPENFQLIEESSDSKSQNELNCNKDEIKRDFIHQQTFSNEDSDETTNLNDNYYKNSQEKNAFEQNNSNNQKHEYLNAVIQ